MPNTNINRHPRTGFDDFQITGANMSGDALVKVSGVTVPTVPTAAGTIEAPGVIAPVAGTISAVRLNFKDALAAHDTNYVEFKLINKGQAGAGTTNVLSVSPANTSKITGGTAVAAYTKYETTLNSSNTTVAKNDVLVLQAISNGTLANTLTLGRVQIHFLYST